MHQGAGAGDRWIYRATQAPRHAWRAADRVLTKATQLTLCGQGGNRLFPLRRAALCSKKLTAHSRRHVPHSLRCRRASRRGARLCRYANTRRACELHRMDAGRNDCVTRHSKDCVKTSPRAKWCARRRSRWPKSNPQARRTRPCGEASFALHHQRSQTMSSLGSPSPIRTALLWPDQRHHQARPRALLRGDRVHACSQHAGQIGQ